MPRMGETSLQLHVRAANRPADTTKLLVGETFPKRGGTSCAAGGISAGRYLRQNAGVKSTRTLKISSRPTSIAAVQIQVCVCVSSL